MAAFAATCGSTSELLYVASNRVKERHVNGGSSCGFGSREMSTWQSVTCRTPTIARMRWMQEEIEGVGWRRWAERAHRRAEETGNKKLKTICDATEMDGEMEETSLSDSISERLFGNESRREPQAGERKDVLETQFLGPEAENILKRIEARGEEARLQSERQAADLPKPRWTPILHSTTYTLARSHAEQEDDDATNLAAAEQQGRPLEMNKARASRPDGDKGDSSGGALLWALEYLDDALTKVEGSPPPVAKKAWVLASKAASAISDPRVRRAAQVAANTTLSAGRTTAHVASEAIRVATPVAKVAVPAAAAFLKWGVAKATDVLATKQKSNGVIISNQKPASSASYTTQIKNKDVRLVSLQKGKGPEAEAAGAPSDVAVGKGGGGGGERLQKTQTYVIEGSGLLESGDPVEEEQDPTAATPP